MKAERHNLYEARLLGSSLAWLGLCVVFGGLGVALWLPLVFGDAGATGTAWALVGSALVAGLGCYLVAGLAWFGPGRRARNWVFLGWMVGVAAASAAGLVLVGVVPKLILGG